MIRANQVRREKEKEVKKKDFLNGRISYNIQLAAELLTRLKTYAD